MFKHLRDCTLIVTGLTILIWLLMTYSQDVFNAIVAFLDSSAFSTFNTLKQPIDSLLRPAFQAILAIITGVIMGLIATDTLHSFGALSPAKFFNKETYNRLNNTSKNLYILGCFKLGVCSIPLFTSLAYLPDYSPIEYHDYRDLIAPVLTFVILSLILICTSNKYLEDILKNTNEHTRNAYIRSDHFRTKYKLEFKEANLVALKARDDEPTEFYERYLFEDEKIITPESRQ